MTTNYETIEPPSDGRIYFDPYPTTADPTIREWCGVCGTDLRDIDDDGTPVAYANAFGETACRRCARSGMVTV